MQKLVYEWVDFSEFSQIWAKIGLNLRKFWKYGVILLKIEPIGMNGSLFLEKLVFVWVYFQIRQRHIPTKTKLEYPRLHRTFRVASCLKCLTIDRNHETKIVLF